MDFIVRMKFWVAVGALVLISGVVFGVWFVPAGRKNHAQMAAWKQKADNVASFAQKERIPGAQDVQNLGDLAAAYKSDLAAITEGLAKEDALLEQHFVDAETGDELSPGTWKVVYGEKMDALEEEIHKSFLSTPDQPILRKFYGTEWPDQQEMRQEEKQYWVQKYIMEALAASNKVRMVVPVFSQLQLVDRPERLLHPSEGQLFEPRAFQIEIATDYKSLPLVLSKLLECQVPLDITGLQIERRSLPALSTRAREKPAQQPGAPAGAAPAPAGVPAGPPAVIPAGPPPGVMGGPPPEALAAARAAAEAGAARARAAAPTGPMGFGMPTGVRGPTGAGRPPSGARRTTRPGAAPGEAGEIPGRLVTVTITGYVLDYLAPKESGEGGQG